MFDNLAFKKWPWTDWDRKLANIMASYWVNFAKTGDPNGRGLPQWPKFTPDTKAALEMGDTVRPMTVPAKNVSFFEKFPGNVGP